MDLTGKHVIITGASQGIGRDIAIHISKLGARVTLIARNEEKLKGTLKMLEGQEHIIYPYDLRKIDGIDELITNIVSQYGVIDGMVHCAGIATMRPLSMTKFNFLHDMMLINFYSFIELARVISKNKNHSGNTSIIGISSVAADNGLKSRVAYCSSKSAMDGAVRALAVELSSKGFRVNIVKPGFIKTELYDDYVKVTGEDAFIKNVLSRQYKGLGETLDIANAVAYLLSDASKFITGTEIIVDGGYLS